MKILVTGAKGFIGKNLVATLKTKNVHSVWEYDRETPESLLEEYCREADFVFNLAGVNRPQTETEFMIGNHDFAQKLLEKLRQYNNNCPVMLASSTQAALDNPYGRSKLAGEKLFLEYAKETGAEVYVFRFPNVFGKWCRPNYNSVVATFCHNIARNIPIRIDDTEKVLRLVYIDDVVRALINLLQGICQKDKAGFCQVEPIYEVKLGEIAKLLREFKTSRQILAVPDLTAGEFATKLYSTYLSYLPEDDFAYDLTMHRDERGSFTEILKTPERGQFSVNITKPGIVKGNHWHHSKNEKFLVVKGEGVIRFRKLGEDSVTTYRVTGEKLRVVDIPPGYTHSIKNIGTEDLVTFMWCNECFDQNRPDTYGEEV